MRRPVLRLLMVVVGAATLSVYLGAAYLGYLLVRTVWELRPPPGTVALYLVAVTVAFAYVSYQVGTAQVLRDLQVRPLAPEQAPALYRRLAAYSDEMGIERPELLLADTGQPNALALGGGLGRGRIVVDWRLVRLLSLDELSAICAHELAHIENRDSLVQTFGYSALQTLSGLVTLALAPLFLAATGLARAAAWIRGRPDAWDRTVPGRAQRAVGALVAGVFFALTLVLLAHSRRREFAADDRAAEVTGDSLALARALVKIENAGQSPWKLLSPLYVNGHEDGPLTRLLSTHPATDERVERLRERTDRERQRVPAR